MIARGKSVAGRSWSCSKPSHIGLTTRLRPTCDRKMFQSWANRRKNVRLVAEVVRLAQRSWAIARGKSVATRSMVMFKTLNLLLQITTPTHDFYPSHYVRYRRLYVARYERQFRSSIPGKTASHECGPFTYIKYPSM